jgi:hypothetical protein
MSSKEDSLDADILATMTPEERAAFEPDEGEGSAAAKQASLQAVIDKPGAGDLDDDDDGEGMAVDADGNEIVDEVVVPPAPVVEPVVVDEPVVPAAKAAPAPEALKLPEGYEGQVTDLATKTKELRQLFKDGEIDIDDFDERNAALVDERVKLNSIQARVTDSQEQVTQGAKANWDSAVSHLFTSVAQAGGTDYATNTERRDDLDGFLKSLSNNVANQSKSMAWFLEEAHKRVNALHGVTAPAPAPAVKPKSAAELRTPPLASAPKNLSQVAGGEAANDIGGEFEQIDALDGEDLEAAIAKLSTSAREKFARGGR